MSLINCKSCNNQFKGNFCNQCGEKVYASNDLTLKSIIGKIFSAFTNLDSRGFKSFQYLFFKPGLLSQKFINGERIKYLSPFQIFLIANVIFFFFLSEIDIFRTPAKWFFIENFDGIRVMDMVNEIALTKGISTQEVALLYDNLSSKLAKGLLILLIPGIALIGLLLNWRKKWLFAKHIVFATHFLAFVLLFCVIWTELVSTFFNPNRWYFIVPITLTMVIYYIASSKLFYKDSWLMSITKGVAAVFFINILIQFYRIAINLISLNTL